MPIKKLVPVVPVEQAEQLAGQFIFDQQTLEIQLSGRVRNVLGSQSTMNNQPDKSVQSAMKI